MTAGEDGPSIPSHPLPEPARGEWERLRARLAEAESTLQAIRGGEVDAVIVDGPRGEQVFTLQSADHPYRVFVEEMSDGAMTLSSDGVILYCNPRFAELLKIPMPQVVGKTFSSFLEPASEAIFQALVRDSQDRRSRGEITARAADRTPVPLGVSLNRMPIGDTEVTCVVAVDLAEAKIRQSASEQARNELERRVTTRTATLAKAVAELQQAQVAALNLTEDAVAARASVETAKARLEVANDALAQQARLLDLASDAISVRDLDGTVRFWNRSAERLYGWTAAEAIGRTVTDLIDLDTAEFERRQQVVLQQGEWTGELGKFTKEGKELTVQSRWTLVRDAQGQPRSILVIDTDLTEKKRLEAQFLRTQRMESIGTLASGVAHDLNNVLAPIQISAQLLRAETSAAERQRILDTIEQGAERGAGIVKQILTFARGIEGERVLLQPRYLIREVLKITQATFPKTITLTFQSSKELWPISGDPTQLHQVLLNLCVNARDAMPHGGTLSVSADNLIIDESFASMTREARPGRYVTFEVRDTGAGIPAAILDRIFEPFFTTKAVGQGTGLGLSTALGIVRSHNGFITVVSQVDRGATFKLFLPAADAGRPALAETAPLPPPRGRGELVLLADDEPAIRETTERMLKQSGYRVLAAADGTEALTGYSAQAGQVQVVLTDIVMPDMDGLALARVLKRMSPSLPIIISTGAENPPQLEQFESLGIKLVLHKPYTTEVLLRTLAAVLRTNPPPPPNPQSLTPGP